MVRAYRRRLTRHPVYRGAVRFDISLPQRVAAGFDAEGTRDYLIRAEELGFTGGWTLEQTIGPSPLLAPLEMLAWAAAHTERLRLGVAVLVSTFHGRFRDVDELPIQPKPVQRPHPPIWFGANAAKAIARAVRHGDAFMGAGSSTTAAFTEAVKTVRRELAEQDRDARDFTIGKRVYLIVDDDPARARERVLAGLRRIYGGMAGIEAVPVAGTPADVVRGLREVIEAGAEMLVLNPVGENVAEDREQMERLAAEVIPRLR